MPKHGITALVDFIEPFEAKKAFTKLAYSQFKSAPLYLEWAPENVFIKSAKKTETDASLTHDEPDETENKIEISTSNATQAKAPAVSESRTDVKGNDIKDDDVTDMGDPENDTTLFVKNLNFKTTEDSLKAVPYILIFIYLYI